MTYEDVDVDGFKTDKLVMQELKDTAYRFTRTARMIRKTQRGAISTIITFFRKHIALQEVIALSLVSEFLLAKITLLSDISL